MPVGAVRLQRPISSSTLLRRSIEMATSRPPRPARVTSDRGRFTSPRKRLTLFWIAPIPLPSNWKERIAGIWLEAGWSGMAAPLCVSLQAQDGGGRGADRVRPPAEGLALRRGFDV